MLIALVNVALKLKVEHYPDAPKKIFAKMELKVIGLECSID